MNKTFLTLLFLAHIFISLNAMEHRRSPLQMTPHSTLSESAYINLVLQRYGFDGIDAVGRDDSTPLEWTIKVRLPHIAELLIKYGANVNTPNKYGRTPLMVACMSSYFKAVKLLLEHGADCNRVDNGNGTPLMIAALLGDNEIAQLLLLHGARINVSNDDRVTALMIAANSNRQELVPQLLTLGATPDIADNVGHTALGLAAERGHMRIVRMLLEAGSSQAKDEIEDLEPDSAPITEPASKKRRIEK